MILGSLSNDRADGNENGKKAIGLISETTTLHVDHAFLYISLPSLPDYNVKVPRLDFRRLPGPVFHPPRRETAGSVTR